MNNFETRSVFPPTMIDNETIVNKAFMQMFVDAILNNTDALNQSNKDIGLISGILADVKEKFESHIANHPSGTEYVHPTTHPASMITGLSTVATSGSYNDLANKPTIPTVDVTKSYVDTELGKKANASHNHSEKVDKNVYDTKVKELSDKIATLERLVDNIINPPLPSFLGLITFKELNAIGLSDLTGLESDKVVKPQTIYTHSTGSTGNKALICAFPKTFGTITGIVDGAGVNIMGNSYNFTEKTFNINGKNVQYIVSSTNEASLFNNSVVIKWNIS